MSWRPITNYHICPISEGVTSKKRLFRKQGWYEEKTKLQVGIKDVNHTHCKHTCRCVHINTQTTTHPSVAGKVANVSMAHTNICTTWVCVYIGIAQLLSLSHRRKWSMAVHCFMVPRKLLDVFPASECYMTIGSLLLIVALL